MQTILPGTRLNDGEVLNFYIHGRGNEPYYKDLIMPTIKEHKADVFGVLLDTFMVYPWFLDLDLSPAKSIFYFPSDGGGNLPLGCENVLRKVDCPVAMSMFAQKQSKEVHGIDTKYIPHAIDTSFYHPLSDEDKLRIKTQWGLAGKFVMGIVARNQGRKMLDRALSSFVKVKDQMPNAVLFMHCDPYDPASYFNFPALIQRYHLENRVIFSGTRYFKAFDYAKMNELYNLMDVFFLPTSGEGFGIPTIEAMAAEIPILITDYTTTNEIVTRNNAGEAIKVSDEILGTWNVERGIMGLDDAAEKMLKLYKDENLRREYGKNGRKAAMRDYEWRDVSQQWTQLINSL